MDLTDDPQSLAYDIQFAAERVLEAKEILRQREQELREAIDRAPQVTIREMQGIVRQ